MTSVFTLCRVTNFLARAEVRHYHNFCRKWKHLGQIFPICKTSSGAHSRQQTPICRGGTGTCLSPLGSILGNGSLHKYNLTRHLSYHRQGQGVRYFCTSRSRNKKEEITVNFLNIDGETIPVKAKVGDTLLDTVIDNDVDIDGFGACEGTLACSTCHLIFDEDVFEIMPEKLDEEEDMLDLAYGLTDTSRLGCQIVLTKEMDNMVARVPEGIADARDV